MGAISMRIKGAIFLVLAIVFGVLGYLLVGEHNTNAIFGALLFGLGGGLLVAALVNLFMHKPQMQ